MEDNVTLLAAFGAGLLSFISPCVLPLIPGYLSYISGMSLDEMRGTGGEAAAPPDLRRRILLSSLAFIAGFSVVFVSLGATATALGQFLLQRLPLLGRIAGVVIVVFGLHTMGVVRIEWLYLEKRFHATRKPSGVVGALVVGLAFAFGWTPCLGPILTVILALAASKDTVADGVRLLAAYSLGLGVPFFLTALAVDRFFAAMRRIRRYYRAVEIGSGALLVFIGLLIFTDRFTVLARWLEPYLPVY